MGIICYGMIRYRGGEMDSLLQSGQRLGAENLSLFLKMNPHRWQTAGSRVSFRGWTERAMCCRWSSTSFSRIRRI